MKNYWKQYAAWVIESTAKIFQIADVFVATRIRITLFYFLAGLFLIIVADSFAFWYITFFIRTELVATLGNEIGLPIAQRITSDFYPVIWIIRIVMIIVMGIAAHIFSKITFRAVKDVLKSQRRFVANASHELRTPLAIMRTTTDIALANKKKLTTEQATEALKSNIEEIDRMTNSLQILLSFSSYENRVNDPVLLRINLVNIVTRAVKRAEPYAKSKKINLFFTTTKPNFFVYGNDAALEEMVSNLVRNGISYSYKNGNVAVKLEENEDEKIVLSVHDNGIGISENDIKHIFEPFFRGQKAANYCKSESAGLGLSIVKDIVKLHGAKIEVKSDPLKGTNFMVNFSQA